MPKHLPIPPLLPVHRPTANASGAQAHPSLLLLLLVWLTCVVQDDVWVCVEQVHDLKHH